VKRLTPKPALQLHHPLYDNYGEAQGLQAARSRLGLEPDGKYALFFGFIRKYKGLDLLYEAMADERVRAAGIQLLVAGEYYIDKAEYEALIARLGIGDRVRLFTDFIPNEDVGSYFSASDVVVLPYRDATNSGITQIAIHFLKPMIATRVGGLPEIVHEGETGLLCEPVPASIADALLRYFEGRTLPNPTLYLQQEKKQLGWRSFAERLLAFVP
jgi:glycosyltransferase involved in cell wall biosynthesis